jgi:hypothetical protein
MYPLRTYYIENRYIRSIIEVNRWQKSFYR